MITQSKVTINVDELLHEIDSRADLTVLDVRPMDERAEWAIPGSVHIDAYEALKAGDQDALDSFQTTQGTPVVTVCAGGKMSLVAAEQLSHRGIDARSLTGGMKAWSLAWNVAACSLPERETEIVQVRRTGKGCLSYLIGSQGEAAVVDPSLDPQIYLDLARRYNWSIAHVLETHIHADHLMRSRMLAERAGAELYLPSNNRVAFAHHALSDGDILDIGDATIRVLATPGHTFESMSYVVDREAVLTGDTLFLEGVGRPDLEASPTQARARAHMLYQSLRRLLTLPPGTFVLPGHASQPIAFDGEPVRATLADVRQRVRLLSVGEEEFVETLLSRIPPTPPNHHQIVALNEAGLFPRGDPTDLEAGANRCAIS